MKGRLNARAWVRMQQPMCAICAISHRACVDATPRIRLLCASRQSVAKPAGMVHWMANETPEPHPYQVCAEIAVLAFLDGRAMDDDLYEAVVWVTAQRMASACVPALDAQSCRDIDNQAGPPCVVRRPWHVDMPDPASTASVEFAGPVRWLAARCRVWLDDVLRHPRILR